MTTQFFIPNPALRELVHYFLFVEYRLDSGQAPGVCPFPPSPQHCIYFYINEPLQAQRAGETSFVVKPPSIIVGPQLTRVNLQLGSDHRMLCVAFHPGGLHRFLHVPMYQLFDQDNDSSDVMGPMVKQINEQLKEAAGAVAVKTIVENFMLARIGRVKAMLPFDFAMKQLLQSDGRHSIDELAAMACLSTRQFERRCKERLGLPPKLFARLARFSRAYRMKELHPGFSWTHIAHTCGYFDQMHFIRDFKEFAGVTPGNMQKEIEAAPWKLQAGRHF